MKTHKYEITLVHLEDKDGNAVNRTPFRFIADNHDDIVEVIGRIRNARQLKDDDATAFAVGLKLFSEVMLKNKENPLFADFKPHFGEFMKRLKSSAGATEHPTQE